MKEGDQQVLTCTALGGNPLADLTWFRGAEKIEGPVTIKEDDDFSRSVLTVTAQKSDNSVGYRCDAASKAGPTQSASIRLPVQFKPDKVTVTADPATSVAGRKTVLKCETGSSRPAAEIKWHYKGKTLAGHTASVRPGTDSGEISVSMLEVQVTHLHDGAWYECEATNAALQQSVHSAITLSVKCEFNDVQWSRLERFHGSI